MPSHYSEKPRWMQGTPVDGQPAPDGKSFTRRAGEAVGSLGESAVEALPEGLRSALREVALLSGLLREGDAPEEVEARVRDAIMSLPLPVGGGGLSAEDLVEGAPAIGAGVGALTGGAPAAGGAALGEIARQEAREFQGKPPATGLITDFAGMDPESATTGATNVAIEAGTSGLGSILSKLSGPLSRGINRSRQNLVKLPKNLRETPDPDNILSSKAERLLERADQEGILKPGSTRERQRIRADERLADAKASQKSILEGLGPEASIGPEEVAGVLDDVAKMAQPSRPGGPARTGQAVADQYMKVIADAEDFVRSTAGAPLESAQGPRGRIRLSEIIDERSRLDREVAGAFDTPETAPAKRALERMSNTWRKSIRTNFPELADANLRLSDMIKINKHIFDAMQEAKFAGSSLAEEGAAAGAGVFGRMSIIGMAAGRATATATAGPVSSTSKGLKKIAHTIVSDPARL